MKNKKIWLGLIIMSSLSLGLFLNATTAPKLADLNTAYLSSLDGALNTWLAQDMAKYSTGHKCQATVVGSGVNASQVGKPYITPKIKNLGALMKDLGSIYPYVNAERKEKITKISRKVYQYLYRQIDWNQNLIMDDYGLCYEGNPKSYSFLTTPEVLKGLVAFHNILPATDSDKARLKVLIPALALAHLQLADRVMTPIGRTPAHVSANYMALTLSTLSILNDIDPKNAYFNNLRHRMITDYAWIRQSWINSESEQFCDVPLLFGGWSHQTPEVVAQLSGRRVLCDDFRQDNTSAYAKSMRSYYLQKVGYHEIITSGLLGLKKLLVSRNACGLVNYGSQGTCVEIDMILRNSSGWVFEIMKADGSIPTAYKSFAIDEFNYFNDRYGSRPGIRSIMSILDGQNPTSIVYKLGFPDNGKVTSQKKLASYKTQVYKLFDYEVRRNTVIELGDSYFVAEKLYRNL